MCLSLVGSCAHLLTYLALHAAPPLGQQHTALGPSCQVTQICMQDLRRPASMCTSALLQQKLSRWPHTLCVDVQDHMSLERHWFLNGQNYSRTLETWLQRQDRHRKQILPIMEVIIWTAALGTNWTHMVLLSHSSS